jgi:hypothetical protein
VISCRANDCAPYVYDKERNRRACRSFVSLLLLPSHLIFIEKLDFFFLLLLYIPFECVNKRKYKELLLFSLSDIKYNDVIKNIKFYSVISSRKKTFTHLWFLHFIKSTYAKYDFHLFNVTNNICQSKFFKFHSYNSK